MSKKVTTLKSLGLALFAPAIQQLTAGDVVQGGILIAVAVGLYGAGEHLRGAELKQQIVDSVSVDDLVAASDHAADSLQEFVENQQAKRQ